MESKQNIFLRKVSIATLVAIFLVVIAGGVVRMSGSGMGCPDWPKCFGQYVPPTSIEELPDNYKDIYSEKRAKKIEKFSDYLEKLGMPDVAIQLKNDKSLLEEQNFNAIQTWTEYINRLTGALSGVFMLLCLILSFFAKQNKKKLIFLAFIQLIVTYFQAWMGSIVVATNLLPWVLTIHMLLAIIIIFIQMLHIRTTYVRPKKIPVTGGFKRLVFFVLALSLIQIILGTQVRQQVDEYFALYPRSEWIEHLNNLFKFHRSFSIGIILLNIIVLYINIKKYYGFNLPLIIVSTLLIEVLSGITMAYFAFPRAMQPTHLLFSFIIISLQFSLYLKIKKA